MLRTDQSVIDENFWEKKWQENQTGWDLGSASPPIVEYFKSFPNKNIKILIPGCGNAHEAEFLLKEGFKNITILDISPTAVAILKQKFKKYPEIKIINQDFFLHESSYDVMIEQTFFCALNPIWREKYAIKSSEILAENGKIIGLLFDTLFEKEGPPFGGSISEYEPIFKKHFEIQKMEACYNSAEPRKGSEAFIILKKNN